MRSLTLAAAALLLACSMLAGCETPIQAPPYPPSSEANATLRGLALPKISIAAFEGPQRLDNCRGLKPLVLPTEASPALYVQKAFESEFLAAGLLAPQGAGVTLSGRIDTLSFSSTKLITMGEWTIGLSLRSSNGKALRMLSVYEFDSAFEARESCRYTADAFAPAVQKLVTQTVGNPGFAGLLHR